MLPVTRFIGSIGSLLALLALMPKELQDQIPQLFPEQYRGKIGVLLALLVFVSRYVTTRAETRRRVGRTRLQQSRCSSPKGASRRADRELSGRGQNTTQHNKAKSNEKQIKPILKATPQ